MTLMRLGTVIVMTSATAFATGEVATVHAQSDTAGSATPGPRDCFWRRGPFGAAPYINMAYPDANVFYWAGVFTISDGNIVRPSS